MREQERMLFGPQRGSVLTIFDRLLSTFGVPAAVVVLALLSGNMDALLENIVVLVILLMNPVMRLMQYLFTYYAVDGEKFHVKSGLFHKKHLELPLDRITTVEFSQNLIFQWMGIYSIKVDNASNYGGSGAGKVTLALKKQEAIQLKALLLSKQEAAVSDSRYVMKTASGETISYGMAAHVEDVQTGRAVSVPVAKILIMGALQSKRNALVQVLSAATMLIGMGNVVMDSEFGMEERLLDLILRIPGLAIAAMIAAAFIVLTTVLGAVFSLVKYYGFTVMDSGEAILLQYGLLTKKKHSLLKEKISGVEYIQSLPMRWFGIGSLNVMAVGYGDDPGTEMASMLYPLIREKEMASFLENYIPELAVQKGMCHRPLVGSLGYFFLCFRLFFTAALIAAFALAEWQLELSERAPVDLRWIWIICCILLTVVCISIVMEYRTAAVCADERNVMLISGAFEKVKTIVKTDKIESVSDEATALKRRKGIATVYVGILAPMGDSVKRVRNMHFGAFESIRDVMRY